MPQDNAQLHRIARLYYLEQMNQRAIAHKLNVSIATVSRALTRAREVGIVRISLADDPDSSHKLEAEIETRFGIRECQVIPAAERPESAYPGLANVLGGMMPRMVRRGGLVGISWGATLKAVGESLSGTATVQADVVPAVGAMGTIETGIFPNSIARAFAGALGGRAWLVNAPAVLDSGETAERLRGDSTFASVREMWGRLDLAVLGASSLGVETSLYRGGVFTADELKLLRDAGGVAATNFLIIDRDGAVIEHPLASRIMCVSEAEMRRTATVVVVASGIEKAAAIAAILRSGLVHILITDAATAEAVRQS